MLAGLPTRRSSVELEPVGTHADGLADLALGRLRYKIPVLRAALTYRFSAHHAVIVSTILSRLEFLDELITGLTTEIEVVIGPFSQQVELLDTVPGVSLLTAQGLLAEIGVHMAVFALPPGWHPGRGMPGASRIGWA